jgi:hypothetical protein
MEYIFRAWAVTGRGLPTTLQGIPDVIRKPAFSFFLWPFRAIAIKNFPDRSDTFIVLIAVKRYLPA